MRGTRHHSDISRLSGGALRRYNRIGGGKYGGRSILWNAAGAGMPAFVWITNHRMWQVVAPFETSLDVLKAYIGDPSCYVYWSTPRFTDEIAVGDVAYIHSSVDTVGIVARGVVEESPRLLTGFNGADFKFPPRLTPPGWDEVVAPSSWKTGIRILETFWDAPVDAGRQSAAGVGKMSEEEARVIEGRMKGR